jgi:hypothetical protein
MPKKIVALSEYVTASEAADILSIKHKRPIDPKYVRTLSLRKNNPVRTQVIGNRLLYNREDLQSIVIRRRE